jgi:glutamate carboxypeptidase
MERSAALPLLERVRRLEHRRFRGVEDVAVGGISDANLTAAAGVPTLDGLGAVGGGAHADDEWVDLEATIGRVPLLADLIHDLVRHPLHSAASEAPATRRTE